MKKVIKLTLVTIILFGFTQTPKAQTAYETGSIDLFLDLGVTSGLGFVPISVGGNFMIMDFLSVGAELGFRLDNQKYYLNQDNQKLKRSGFGIITRGDYHFNELLGTPDEFDLFAGIDLGVAFYGSYKYNGVVIQNSKAYFLGGPHVGGKWFFAEKFGIHGIFGWRSGDGAHAGFGIVFRMK